MCQALLWVLGHTQEKVRQGARANEQANERMNKAMGSTVRYRDDQVARIKASYFGRSQRHFGET